MISLELSKKKFENLITLFFTQQIKMSFKKPNYEKKISNLKNRQEIIDRNIQGLKEYELLVYGKEGSMFYGLKTPSLYKILEYMCDEYNIPYDVMFNMIYHNLMKIYYKKHMDRVFQHFNWIKSRDYRATQRKKFCGLRQVDLSVKEKNYYDHLYLGDIKYQTDGFRESKKNWSCITCKSKKYFEDNYYIDYDNFKQLDKKQIIEQLNKLGIKFKLSDTKEKLMSLLVKNEPSGFVE
tara:strand:- start:2164 stop:2874 length:711 start_codon:yes stop_codon:yes gene_type:complete